MFKIGDRVISIEPVGNANIISAGTIKKLKNSESEYLIEFDKNIKGHDGNGYLTSDKGWFIPEGWFRLLNRKFKVGDTVEIIHRCSGTNAGETYILKKESGEKELHAGGCTCQNNWILLKRKEKIIYKFKCHDCHKKGARYQGGLCKKCNAKAF